MLFNAHPPPAIVLLTGWTQIPLGTIRKALVSFPLSPPKFLREAHSDNVLPWMTFI